MTRRALLAALPVCWVSACVARPGAATLADDAAKVAAGLSAIAGYLTDSSNVPDATATQLRGAAADASAAAAHLAQAPGIPWVQQLVAAIGLVAQLAAPFGLPPIVLALLDAARSLAPILLAEAGIAAETSGFLTPRYTPAQARALLAAAQMVTP